MEILEQKIIIRDKTIDRLKTELYEVNKLNLLLEEQIKENQKIILKLSKPKKRQYTKKNTVDGSFVEPEPDIGEFISSEFIINESEILMNPSAIYQKDKIYHIIEKYNGSLTAQYEYHAQPNLLTSNQCLKIINYMDNYECVECDDGGGCECGCECEKGDDHKLNITEVQLIELIGKRTFKKIMSLYSGTYTTIYIRKVLGNNSLIEFHKDYSSRTMKIPLNDAHEYNGGDLIYLTDGKIHKPEQLKGSVTIHNNDIIHGVTPIVNGTRYSLFILDTP